MQHLSNQNEQRQTRKWNFDQKWNNVEHALNKENQERTEDVDLTQQNLQNKIRILTQLETNKVNVIQDNLKYIKSQADNLERNTQSTLQKMTDFSAQYTNRSQDFICEYLQNSNSFCQKILLYSKQKCTQIQRKLHVTDQSIKRKSQQQMTQLKVTSINHIKQILNTQTQSQKTHLEGLNTLVMDSIKNMRDMMRQYQKDCAKSQLKLQEEVQRLDHALYKTLEKENKQGDMTYDCLLKLVQDSCSKIQDVRLRA